MRKAKLTSLGSISVGDKFVFRTAEVFGSQYASKKPPYDGKVLTVVGFKAPRYVNRVVVTDSDGRESLLTLDMAEKALKLQGDRKK